MGGSISQVFQSGSAFITNSHGHRVNEATKQKVQTVFDALRANPKIGVQRLEGLLQQIPKVFWLNTAFYYVILWKIQKLLAGLVYREGWLYHVCCRMRIYWRCMTRPATIYCRNVSVQTMWSWCGGCSVGTALPMLTGSHAVYLCTSPVSKGEKYYLCNKYNKTDIFFYD